MEPKFQVGDRVCKHGWLRQHEEDKYGSVIECYHGLASANDKGVPFMAIKWDDGTISRGHINMVGEIVKFDGQEKASE